MENGQGNGGVRFSLDSDGGKLLAHYTPHPAGKVPGVEELRSLLDSQGYGQFLLKEGALPDLAKRCTLSSIGFTVEIGEKRDATLAVSVSDDFMTAKVTITPAAGGRRVTREDLVQALAQQGVVSGLLDREIDAVIQRGHAQQEMVAAGTPPRPGEDAQMVSLIEEMKEQAPQLRDDEIADYRNLGEIVSVALGDPLLRRTRSTKGVPGRDLAGREIPAPDGKEIDFAPNLTGVACALHDQDLLVAAISGYPVLVPNGVVVDPVFKVKRVDLSTGNLHFKGSLEIAGDVTEGMEVTATEGILVGGIVEAATLIAGGDIEVKGGVIGHGKLALEGQRDTAQLRAGGSVTVQFAENAVIEAAKGIVVKELAMQSELTSGTDIRVGEGGRKGHIIGGLCRAASLVHAVTIGSHAGVPTVIEVGVDPSLNQKLGYVTDALAEKGRLIEELTKTLSYVKEHPGSMEPGLVRLKERVYAKHQAEIAELTGEKKRLQKRIEINGQAEVRVERDAFLGVQIRIGSSSYQLEEDLINPTFSLGEEGVQYS